MTSDWMTQLAPERAPPPPPWWPPAPGWWILGAVLILLAGAAAAWWQFSPQRRRRHLQRAALAELARIRTLNASRQANGLQQLLRRYALSVYGPAVATLSGEDWLRFLAARGAEAFGGVGGRYFLEAAYGRSGAPQPEWLSAAEAFIRRAPRAEAQ